MSVHDEFIKSMSKLPHGLKLPPPSMLELKLEYLEVKPREKMVAKLPFQERFTNPIGTFQGGLLAAGIDDVFGPLSYVSYAGPTMTLSLNVTYLKAFRPEMGHCLIEAQVLKITNNFIFMRADVKSPVGELLAHAESHVSKVKNEQPKI